MAYSTETSHRKSNVTFNEIWSIFSQYVAFYTCMKHGSTLSCVIEVVSHTLAWNNIVISCKSIATVSCFLCCIHSEDKQACSWCDTVVSQGHLWFDNGQVNFLMFDHQILLSFFCFFRNQRTPIYQWAGLYGAEFGIYYRCDVKCQALTHSPIIVQRQTSQTHPRRWQEDWLARTSIMFGVGRLTAVKRWCIPKHSKARWEETEDSWEWNNNVISGCNNNTWKQGHISKQCC